MKIAALIVSLVTLVTFRAGAAVFKKPVAGTATAKPYNFLVEHTEFSAKAGTRRFTVGLQDAAREDLLATASDRAQAGFMYSVFLKKGGKYFFAGKIFLHETGFQVLQSKHSGVHDILTYVRNGAAESDLVTYEFDGKQFQSKSTKRIKFEEFDRLLRVTKVDIQESPAGVPW